jgi:hypothetical protein
MSLRAALICNEPFFTGRWIRKFVQTIAVCLGTAAADDRRLEAHLSEASLFRFAFVRAYMFTVWQMPVALVFSAAFPLTRMQEQ